jgi:hypothetical protein
MSLNGKYNGSICRIHIKYCVLHAKSHVSLPSYSGSTFQRMTPVVPHGLTLATQEHYMVTFLCFTEHKRGDQIYRAIREWVNPQENNPPWQRNRNQCSLYLQPPKVIISSPHMPMPCIENAKYDNPRSI